MHQELHHFLFANGLFEDLEIEVPPGYAGSRLILVNSPT